MSLHKLTLTSISAIDEAAGNAVFLENEHYEDSTVPSKIWRGLRSFRTLKVASAAPLDSPEEFKLLVRTLDTFNLRCAAFLGCPGGHPQHHWTCF